MRLKSSSLELLALLVLVCSLRAAVINLKAGDACANICSGKEEIFKYEENKIYVYNFLSRHSIKNPNAKEETLQLELTGKAQVSKIAACDFGLLLSDVKLKESFKEQGSVNKEYDMMKKMLEKYPLRFGFDDGSITGVCQDNQDNEFAVNIKRAILSSLQVSINSLETPNYLTETDIAGECITEYTPKAEPPNFVIITKKKSIAGCSKKNQYFTTLTGRQYDKPMETRNMALLDGDYNCEIKVKISDGLKESICQESHIFRPFQSETEGSRILINQELKFDSIKDGKIDAKKPTTRSDLIMNHGDRKPLHMTQKFEKPQSVMKEICRSVKEKAISIKVTELFLSLIRSMGESSYDEIKAMYKGISDDALCNENSEKIKGIFVDATTNVRTDAAFRFLIEDAMIYKLTKLGLSVFDNPTSTMIATLTKKLNDASSYYSITILLSSMIKSFCENTPGCLNNPDIIKAMDIMTNNLGSNCEYQDKTARSKILYTLRAISNSGNHPNPTNLIKIIEACALSKSNDDDVKVFSIQAVRQFPCNENIDKFLWKIFKDIELNSELRIEAYLSLARCPTRSMFGLVIQHLGQEQSQQLGSFVWSHISNLMETADRFKTDLRDLLQIFTKPMDELEKKFNLDFKSYSKNIEKTYQRGDSAAKIDTNIIFSPSSPIPSSININTTIDIFGRSINLFEFGIRGKGIVDSILGNSIRPKPHDNLHPNVVEMHKKINKPVDKQSLSLYTRFMGRDVYFSPNIISDFMSVMFKSTQKTSFERSLLILDTTVSVASISGFPVELQIESAASVNFNMAKKSSPVYTDIDLSTKSNYGIQITGKLQVNAHCTKIGVQSKGTLSRDMEFGGKLKFKDSPTGDFNDYQFELNKIPDNSKLFSISNELSLIHKLSKVQMIKPFDVKLEKCTGEGMLNIMGMKVCFLLKEAPRFSSYFPNMKAEVTIEKFSGFKFQWKKESFLQPIKKMKSLLVSVSFSGSGEEAFRLQIDRNKDRTNQVYEILLWKKFTYLKFEVNDKKVTGQLKSGNTNAILSGMYQDKGIFTSEINVDITSDKNTGKLYFQRKITKSGPEIKLKLSKNGENGFNLDSSTTELVTTHKTFKQFRRIRHSTTLRYAGENEMSFMIENSIGQDPGLEMQNKIKILWKTKAKINFLINQNSLFEKLPEEKDNALFGKVSGTKWVAKMDHSIEVNGKKFNVTNNLVYFISNDFGQVFNKPSLMLIHFVREDIEKKVILFETSSELGMDISNIQNGKILVEGLLNYPVQRINRKLKSNVTWKLNKIQMYDINAEIDYAAFLQLYFRHKFTSSQSGITFVELKIADTSYKISSELNLPKSHSLTIYWPGNNIEITSKVDVKSLSTFHAIVNHDLKMNNELIANIINTAKYNQKIKEISVNSVSKSVKGTEIYNVGFEGKYDIEFVSKKIFYNLLAKTTLKIPSRNVNHRFTIEEMADIDLDGQIVIKKNTFKSKIVLENMREDVGKRKYGYYVIATKKEDSVSYSEVKVTVFKGEAEDSTAIKFGVDNKNVLFGVNMNVKDKINTELMYKSTSKNKIFTNSMLMFLKLKDKPQYNYYYKRDMVVNYAKEGAYSVKWNGTVGKGKEIDNRSSFNGLITLDYKGWKKVDLTLNINAEMFISKIDYILSYELRNEEPGRYSGSFKNILKWQKAGTITANYYDFQSNGNFDNKFKKIEFDAVLTKNSATNKIFSVQVNGVYDKNVNFDIKCGQKFVKFVMNIYSTENSDKVIKFNITSSYEVLKELTLALERKTNEGSDSVLTQMVLKGKDKDYKLKITRLQKKNNINRIDFVEDITWNSNIPYIESGSHVLGLLSQKKDFQCNLSLMYKERKIIDFKTVTSDISQNLKISTESFFEKPFKFLTTYTRKDNVLNSDLEISYADKYFKIPKMEIMYKNEKGIVSSSVNIVMKTSLEKYREITLYNDASYDMANTYKSFKSKYNITLNGETLYIHNIDMSKGTIYIRDKLGKYITDSKMPSYEFNSECRVLSIKDFMISYKLTVNEKDYSKLRLDYYRMTEKELPMKIYSLGETRFYFNLKFKTQTSSSLITVFIDKDTKNGMVKLQADVPQIKLKFDEIKLTFQNIKDDSNVYTGIVKYDGFNYKFEYKRSNGFKRDFTMTATSTNAKPQKAVLSFDFTKDYIFKLLLDSYLKIDVNLLSTGVNTKSGKIEFTYKGDEIMNTLVEIKHKLPKEATNAKEILKALIGIIRGYEFSLKVNGKLMKKDLKSEFELSHLVSNEFAGGTKTYEYINVVISGDKTFFMKSTFDRNVSYFNYEGQFLIKSKDEIKYKETVKLAYKSRKDVVIECIAIAPNFELRLLSKNNDDVIDGLFFYKVSSKQHGLGFKWMKNTYETSLNYITNESNMTYTTNLGFMMKQALAKKYSEMFLIGQEYQVLITDAVAKKNVMIKILRSKEMTIELVFESNYFVIEGDKLTIKIYDERSVNEMLGIEVKRNTANKSIKSFDFKSTVKVSKKSYRLTFVTKLNVDKSNVVDLMLEMYSTQGKSPYNLDVKYKGTYLITGKAVVRKDTMEISHSIDVKDGKFKTDLWSSSSNCQLIPEFDCYYLFKNKERDVKIAITWKKNINMLELSWNKNKGQGFILSCERQNKLTIITISNPLQTIKLTREADKINGMYKRNYSLEVIRKADASQRLTLSIEGLMKGSIKSDYNVNIQVKTNLLKRGIKLSIDRKVGTNIGDLYVLNITSSFQDENKPFFTLESTLRKISAKSYEIKIHATNNDRFLSMISSITFADEELSFEYKLIQNDKLTREFIFQFIPFRKFLLSNKRDFKILFSRTSYQYGYRRDIVLSLGKEGPNITAFTTFIRSPLKYYAEVSGKNKKLVVHFRSVGNTFIGDVYRKISGKKVQDLSLKISNDANNSLTTEMNWNTKAFENYKELLNKILTPNNLKSILVDVYQNYENQISTFTSQIKMALAKAVHVQLSLDLIKGIVYDIENIPNAFANIYNDDGRYMKSIFNSTKVISKLMDKIGVAYASISQTLYEWFVEAKLYGLIYNPINIRIQSISYEHIKNLVNKVEKIGNIIAKKIFEQFDRIADLLESLSKHVKSVSFMASKVRENIRSAFKSSSLSEMIELLGEVKSKVLDGLSQIIETSFIKQRLEYYKETITNLKDMVSMIKEMRMKMMDYIMSSNAVKNIADTVRFIKDMDYKNAFLSMIKPELSKFDLDAEKGTVYARCYVYPMVRTVWKMWQTAYNWLPSETLSLLRGKTLRGKLLDLFYTYEYYLFNYGSPGSLRAFLPPFKKTAWVLGGNSILTYDGNSIRIGSGKCSYLLATDSKIASFSLVMNIIPEKKLKEFELSYIKKITVLSSGSLQIDGKSVDLLPQLISINGKSVEITRNFDILKIVTSEGLTIEYFFNLDYLKVTFVGYWHGKVVGLLGSNDFESINDRSTPDGSITHDAGKLATAWSIDKCNSKTKTGLYSVHVNKKYLQDCIRYFKLSSTSYLSRCYGFINPEPYYELCQMSLQYSEMKQKEFDELICNLSRNYILRCRLDGVMIRLSKSCVTCRKDQLASESSVELSKKKLKFNYIFIVEQTKCLLPYKSLVENVVNVMSLEKDSIYTLMAFNGLNVFKVPHFKSINKEIITNSDGLKLLLKDITSPFQLRTVFPNHTSTEGGQAIYDAIKMPSKSGYIEKFIFIGCSVCSEFKNDIYSVLAGLLKDAGISITYLTAQSFTSSNLVKETVGIGNNKEYYFDKDELKSRAWKKDFQPPNDLCSSLARLNDGYVWSLNTMNSEMRQRRVAETLHSEIIKVTGKPKQKCTCRNGPYENGQVECKVRGLM